MGARADRRSTWNVKSVDERSQVFPSGTRVMLVSISPSPGLSAPDPRPSGRVLTKWRQSWWRRIWTNMSLRAFYGHRLFLALTTLVCARATVGNNGKESGSDSRIPPCNLFIFTKLAAARITDILGGPATAKLLCKMLPRNLSKGKLINSNFHGQYSASHVDRSDLH